VVKNEMRRGKGGTEQEDREQKKLFLGRVHTIGVWARDLNKLEKRDRRRGEAGISLGNFS